MLDRRKLRGHREKPDEKDQAFRVKGLKSENDQIKDQAHGHRYRTAHDQLMPLGLCHGSPPHPYLRHYPRPFKEEKQLAQRATINAQR